MTRKDPQPTTLYSILARFNFFTTLLAVALAWLAILLAGMAALQSYATQNLEMAAQLASYGAEPGLVFDDAEAVRDAITPLLEKEGIARLHILTAGGSTFVDAISHRANQAPALTRIFIDKPIKTQIYRNGGVIGHVEIWGNGNKLGTFLRLGSLAGIACLGITVIGTFILRRRFDQELNQPLRDIAAVVHDVRLHRRFDQRVSPVGVQELDRLGADINALLVELEGWQGHIESERAVLTHRATHDPLTALPNRGAFDLKLADHIEKARKDSRQFALVFIDADNFKAANDAHGHAAGDQLLKIIAQRTEKVLRTTDFAARFGGDEFVIILDPINSVEDTQIFVQNLRQQVAEEVMLEGSCKYHPSISVGVAAFPTNGETPAELLTAADSAMYADKFSHRLEEAPKKRSRS